MSGVQTAIPLVLCIGASIIAVISIVAAINSMLSWFGSLLDFPQLSFQVKYLFYSSSFIIETINFSLKHQSLYSVKVNNNSCYKIVVFYIWTWCYTKNILLLKSLLFYNQALKKLQKFFGMKKSITIPQHYFYLVQALINVFYDLFFNFIVTTS